MPRDQTKEPFFAIIRGFMDTNTNPLFQWTAPVQPVIERGQRWYVIGGVTVLAIAAYGIITNSWPTAVVSILCGAMYFLLRDHKPRNTGCALYETGVMYDGTFHRWDSFAGFWILETPGYTELHLSYPKAKRDVVIQMTGIAPDDMRLACGAFLKELTDKKESLIDIFTRIAKL